MLRIKYLYAIMDPRDDTVLYIGQTYDLSKRYKEHLRGDQDIDKKMRELISQNVTPEMKMLSRHKEKINSAERAMIAKAKKQNKFLLNRLIPIKI